MTHDTIPRMIRDTDVRVGDVLESDNGLNPALCLTVHEIESYEVNGETFVDFTDHGSDDDPPEFAGSFTITRLDHTYRLIGR